MLCSFLTFLLSGTFVQLNYTLALPSLQTPAVTYSAKWSGSVPPSIDWSRHAPIVLSGNAEE